MACPNCIALGAASRWTNRRLHTSDLFSVVWLLRSPTFFFSFLGRAERRTGHLLLTKHMCNDYDGGHRLANLQPLTEIPPCMEAHNQFESPAASRDTGRGSGSAVSPRVALIMCAQVCDEAYSWRQRGIDMIAQRADSKRHWLGAKLPWMLGSVSGRSRPRREGIPSTRPP